LSGHRTNVVGVAARHGPAKVSPMIQTRDNPEALVVIARAAHLAGDRQLERAAKAELKERFGIVLRFTRGVEREAVAR